MRSGPRCCRWIRPSDQFHGAYERAEPLAPGRPAGTRPRFRGTDEAPDHAPGTHYDGRRLLPGKPLRRRSRGSVQHAARHRPRCGRNRGHEPGARAGRGWSHGAHAKPAAARGTSRAGTGCRLRHGARGVRHTLPGVDGEPAHRGAGGCHVRHVRLSIHAAQARASGLHPGGCGSGSAPHSGRLGSGPWSAGPGSMGAVRGDVLLAAPAFPRASRTAACIP